MQNGLRERNLYPEQGKFSCTRRLMTKLGQACICRWLYAKHAIDHNSSRDSIVLLYLWVKNVAGYRLFREHSMVPDKLGGLCGGLSDRTNH